MKQTNPLRQTIISRSKTTPFLLALLFTVASSFASANGKTSAIRTNSTDSARGTNPALLAGNSEGADHIGSQVRISFQQDFKNAELIGSELTPHFTKLTFRMDDMILQAFYKDNGKLLAVIHNIRSSQLPINLMRDLKKNYSGYWITELFDLDGSGEHGYYISLENADAKVVLRSTADNAWEVYQHAEKK